MKRCEWSTTKEIYIEYHDNEWGRPQHDDQKLFEAVILDGFQAGLSWIIILQKRENFRKAFDNFNANKIAKYGEKKIQELCQDKGIVRNQLKIRSAVTNAQAYLEVMKEFGSFDKYIWQFTSHKTLHNSWTSMSQIPATSVESDAMSKNMKERGFKFVGSTICYAFMQALGMVNDHLMDCPCYEEIKKAG
ncbi:MAG: DNA-3-methyladenine glycosylase I [Flavobacteriales bacterium]|nr:DNA-3-methyladenine glycosylase I [Flavobacteriales bacterium]